MLECNPVARHDLLMHLSLFRSLRRVSSKLDRKLEFNSSESLQGVERELARFGQKHSTAPATLSLAVRRGFETQDTTPLDAFTVLRQAQKRLDCVSAAGWHPKPSRVCANVLECTHIRTRLWAHCQITCIFVCVCLV